MAALKVRNNRDGTLTLNAGGKFVANVTVGNLTELELAERIRWEFITAGVSVSPDLAQHLAREARAEQ